MATDLEKRLARVHRNDRLVNHDGVEVWAIDGKHSYDPGYYSDEWVRCIGDKHDAKHNESRSDFQAQWKCRYCSGGFIDAEMIDGDSAYENENLSTGKFTPPHIRRLTEEEVARKKLEAAITALGLDPHDETLRDACWAVRDADRRVDQTPLSRLAAGVNVLAQILTRRAAVEQTAAALAELSNMKIGDEFTGFPAANRDWVSEGDEDAPFFTEAFLYPLLGKEAARTVLALFGQLERAAGA